MNRTDILNLARTKMDEHGLHMWRVRFIQSKTYAGLTHYARKTIELSSDYMDVFDDANILDTILHEIAHALVGPHVKSHGDEWRMKAISIGCSGERTVSSDAPQVPGKYTATCPNGHTRQAHKLTHRLKEASCNRCSRVFDWRYKFRIVENATGKLVHDPDVYRADSEKMFDQSKRYVPLKTITPVLTRTVPAQRPAKALSRAQEYDQGTAFINWD